jgi:hypothetical protein
LFLSFVSVCCFLAVFFFLYSFLVSFFRSCVKLTTQRCRRDSFTGMNARQ